jgi:hypothetical protein
MSQTFDLDLFIIYCHSTSLLGKLNYSIRRMSTTAEHSSVCAASDLTHGGQHENELKEWTEAKTLIPANIKQQHYDEIPADVCQTS